MNTRAGKHPSAAAGHQGLAIDATDENTQIVRRLWDGAAEIYDAAIVPALSDAHLALVGLLAPRGGERILDLGCGTGRVAQLVADAGSRVTACDLSDEMVGRARARLRGRGVGIDRMDAQRLAYRDETFDAVVAGFSLMFCPDHAAALSEARRVLRAGGRLAMSVWGRPEECETVTVGRVAAAFGEGSAPDTPTGQALGEPELLRDLLGEAGFTRIEMHSMVMRLRYPGPDACWQAVLHVHGERIPEERLMEAEAATRAEIARVGLPLRNRAWFVSAIGA